MIKMLTCMIYYLYVLIPIFILSSLNVSAPPKSEGLENVRITLLDNESVGIEWSTKTTRKCMVTCKQTNGNAAPKVQTVNSKSVYFDGLIPVSHYEVTIVTVDGKTQFKKMIQFRTLSQEAWHRNNMTFKHLDGDSVKVTWHMDICGVVKYIVSYAPTTSSTKLSKDAKESESVVLTKLIPNTEYKITIIAINSRKKKYECRPAIFRTQCMKEKVMPMHSYFIERSSRDPHCVRISWESPCNDIEGYEVLYNSAREKLTRTVTTKSKYVNLKDLEMDTEYIYRVVAIRSQKRYKNQKQNFRTFSLAEFFGVGMLKKLDMYPPTISKFGGTSLDPYVEMNIIINRFSIRNIRYEINISRTRVVEDTFALLKWLKNAPANFYQTLVVKFKDEMGTDVGGVKQEWITQFSTKVFNPEFKLFTYSDENSTNVEINPESGKTFNHLIQFQAIGLFTAMALLNECYLNVYFSLPLLKTIILRPMNLDDVKIADPALHPGLLWTKNNDPRKLKPKLKFTAPESEEIKLIEKGDRTKVTKENMDKYIRLLINWRFIGRVELQTAAFLKGFYSLIPLSDISVFNEDQLQTLIGGSSKIDVEFWKSCTTYKSCSDQDDIVKWFWEVVGNFSTEMKAKVLEFTTATSRFAINGERKFKFVIELNKHANVNNLPEAQTCFNKIILPKYESSKKLHDKLSLAIKRELEFGLSKK